MKVFIAGAAGRVASQVIRELKAAGHTVRCASRHPERFAPEDDPVFLDFHSSVEEIADLLSGVDAVYFLAGSRGKDLLQTDAFGPVKLAQASTRAGIRRFVLLSSVFALEPEKWSGEPSLASITNYNIAKFFADYWLTTQKDLDYTIVQPSVLTEEPGTGTIELDPPHDGSNPIPDVAAVLADILERKNTYGKVLKLRGGDAPIGQALDSI